MFGAERQVYFREAAVGSSRLLYYFAKVVGTFPRILLATLYFTVLSHLFATPQITVAEAYTINLLYWFSMYGFSSLVAMLSSSENSPMLAIMASLAMGVLGGGSPSLTNAHKWKMYWLWRASPGTWAQQAYFDRQVGPMGALYQIEPLILKTGYQIGRYGKDLMVLFGIGLVYWSIALVFMIWKKH